MKNLLLILIISTTLKVCASDHELTLQAVPLNSDNQLQTPLLNENPQDEEMPQWPWRTAVWTRLASPFALCATGIALTNAAANAFPGLESLIYHVGYFGSGFATFKAGYNFFKNTAKNPITEGYLNIDYAHNLESEFTSDATPEDKLLMVTYAEKGITTTKIATSRFKKCIPILQEINNDAIQKEKTINNLRQQISFYAVQEPNFEESALLVSPRAESIREAIVVAGSVVLGQTAGLITEFNVDGAIIAKQVYPAYPILYLATGFLSGTIYCVANHLSTPGKWRKGQIAYSQAKQLIDKAQTTKLTAIEQDKTKLYVATAELVARQMLARNDLEAQTENAKANNLLIGISKLRTRLKAITPHIETL